MSHTIWVPRVEWLAMAAVILAAGYRANAQENDPAPPDINIEVPEVPAPGEADAKSERPVLRFAEKVLQTLGDFWLGIHLRPVDDALRVQLNLPQGQGLVIETVAPDSPAAQSGLQKNDVLLKAGERPLETPQDLIDVLNSSQGNELAIELYRAGERQTLAVKPGKRMGIAAPQEFFFRKPDIEELKRWVERLEIDPQSALQFRGVGPGILLRNRLGRQRLPADVSVTITGKGEEPAEITVKKGELTWHVKPDELDTLPESVRPFVEGLLGESGPVIDEDIVEVQPAAPKEPAGRLRRGPAADGGVERRFQNLDRRLERLSEELEKFRRERSTDTDEKGQEQAEDKST